MTADPLAYARPGLFLRVTVVMAGSVTIWALMLWVSATAFGDSLTRTNRVVNALLVFALAVPMVVAARRYLDRRPWAGLAMAGPSGAWPSFLAGVAAFMLPSAIGTAVALSAGWLRLSSRVSLIDGIAWVTLLVALVFVFEAFPEELIFRGYIFRNLAAEMPPWLALIGQALLFTVFGTALWVIAEGWGVLAERFGLFLSMAVVIGILRVTTGSVWTCIGFHLAFQVVAQSLLGARVWTDDETVLVLAAIIVPFVLAIPVARMLLRTEANWSLPEPDLPAGPGPRPAAGPAT